MGKISVGFCRRTEIIKETTTCLWEMGLTVVFARNILELRITDTETGKTIQVDIIPRIQQNNTWDGTSYDLHIRKNDIGIDKETLISIIRKAIAKQRPMLIMQIMEEKMK